MGLFDFAKEFREQWNARQHRERIYCNAAFWNGKAESMEGAAVSMWANNHLNALYHQEVLTLLDQWIKPVPESHLLDIGCGTGRMSRHFAHQGFQVTGIDFAEKAVQLAMAGSPAQNPSFRVQSLFDLQDSDAYDLAFTWGVLTFACKNSEELALAMGKIHRSLRPGSQAIFLEPIHTGFLHRVLPMSVSHFCRTLTQCGFEIEATQPLHFWPSRLALAYLEVPPWITAPIYRAGQRLMNYWPGPCKGDYTAVRARVVKQR